MDAILARAQAAGDETRVAIIGAQAMMLTDPLLEEESRLKSTVSFIQPFRAVQETVEEQAAILATLEDPYLAGAGGGRERYRQSNYGDTDGVQEQDLSAQENGTLSWSARRSLLRKWHRWMLHRGGGIVAEIGGKTSHTAILAIIWKSQRFSGCQGIFGRSQ